MAHRNDNGHAAGQPHAMQWLRSAGERDSDEEIEATPAREAKKLGRTVRTGRRAQTREAAISRWTASRAQSFQPNADAAPGAIPIFIL